MAGDLRLSRPQRDVLDETVDESVEALAGRHVDYFSRRLPKREHWRGLSDFGEGAAFLDIETDGGYGRDAVTVVGLYDGFDFSAYVKGENLERFVRDCGKYDAFVTFFGGGFDIPTLIRRFPSLAPIFASRLHIDLCPLLRRIGFRGGLKRIEQEVGIRRIPETEGLDGYDAVRLWACHQAGGRGAEEARELLIAYNREDVVNLKSLLEFTIPRLRVEAGFEAAGA